MRAPAPPPRISGVVRAIAWSGAALFAASLLYFLYRYLVAFGRPVEDGGVVRPTVINTALFTLFALHHSVFARSGIKSRIAAAVHLPLERSLYTWIASALFLLVCAAWQPVPGELYRFSGFLAGCGYAVQATAVWLTARSSAQLDVLDLAGVRQVVGPHPGPADHVPLQTTGLYGLVRHPLYFAWMLLVFASPHMTMTRFTFAVLSTAYLAIAIPFEERSLAGTFGTRYREYQRVVRWRMIPGIY